MESDYDWLDHEHLTGTTIMAVQYKDGVVLGADSRTTTGSYVMNRVTNKINPVSDRIFCCHSGSSADTQFASAQTSYILAAASAERGEPPTVKMAASVLQKILYKYKEELLAGMICAGYDAEDGPSVYNVPLGGSLLRQSFCIGGSGSTYIFGLCDRLYRPDMSKQECLDFVTTAVSHAMNRDGSSGGLIRTLVITKDGTERGMIPGDKVFKTFDC
eukprot:TRINITY_DN891_c0_g1_i1.p1 TRINITY_DN891_c0_g1~~TRINITY_DN891_c0_g1_i1.p1  ORF type:complete len:216 (-),score=29.62 TRINITY_DN891_c0_g1_i1:32-679(-)